MTFTRYWSTLTIVIGVIAIAGVPIHAQENKSGGVITIHVDGLINDKGNLNCTLCSSADGYPGDCKDKEIVKAAIHGNQSDCVFPNKAPGDYAATVFHDEDASGKFKRNLVGIPKEGFGFSNNFRPTVRAPKWDEAKFNFSGGQRTITIHIINW
jgi:uncharacterized protein (DUF2141 family)